VGQTVEELDEPFNWKLVLTVDYFVLSSPVLGNSTENHTRLFFGWQNLADAGNPLCSRVSGRVPSYPTCTV
jgi:hypothetical protein